MKYARPSLQIPLFDLQPRFIIEKNAQARNAYGTAAQDIVCRALGLNSIPIDGNCEVCFDASKDGVDYEIKSVHAASKVVCYDWRLAKEERAEKEDGRTLSYAILIHRVRGERDSSLLFPRMILEGRILVVPAFVVRNLARREKLNKLKAKQRGPRFGYDRVGYVDGYRNLPVKSLLGLLGSERRTAFDLYGQSYEIPVLEKI